MHPVSYPILHRGRRRKERRAISVGQDNRQQVSSNSLPKANRANPSWQIRRPKLAHRPQTGFLCPPPPLPPVPFHSLRSSPAGPSSDRPPSATDSSLVASLIHPFPVSVKETVCRLGPKGGGGAKGKYSVCTQIDPRGLDFLPRNSIEGAKLHFLIAGRQKSLSTQQFSGGIAQNCFSRLPALNIQSKGKR